MPHIRVLAFVAVGGPGGPVKSLIEAVSGLPQVEFTVTGSLTEDNRRQFEHLGAQTAWVPRPSRLRNYPGVILALVRLLVRRRAMVDVVHANGLTEAAMLTLPARMLRVPMVVWCHDSWAPRVSRIAGRLHGFSHTVRWAAVSPLAARVAAQVAGDVELTIIPNPIDLERIRTHDPPKLASTPLRVAYLGTDRPAKGFDVLVEIIAKSAPGEFSWFLAATRSNVWNEDAWNRLEQLTSERTDIKVNGHVEDVDGVYRSADVVLVTSHTESFCRVAVEAMAHGIPVVATDLEPLVHSVANSRSGEVFPAGDAEAGLTTLRAVAENIAGYQGVGKHAAARYSIERVAPILMEQYRLALNSASSRRA